MTEENDDTYPLGWAYLIENERPYPRYEHVSCFETAFSYMDLISLARLNVCEKVKYYAMKHPNCYNVYSSVCFTQIQLTVEL